MPNDKCALAMQAAASILRERCGDTESKWNKYRIKTPKGYVFEVVVGDWLKPGNYSFGRVELIRKVGKEEESEFHNMETELVNIWYNSLKERGVL